MSRPPNGVCAKFEINRIAGSGEWNVTLIGSRHASACEPSEVNRKVCLP